MHLWRLFCDACSLQEVGRKTLESLINSGALDEWGNRLQLNEVLETMLKRSKTSNNGGREFQDSLFGDEEISVPIVLPDRTVTVEDEIQLAQKERELLGQVVGEKTLYEVIEEIGAQVSNLANIETLTKGREGDRVKLIATVVSVRPHITRKGDRMAFLNVEDLTGQITALAFSGVFAEAEALLQPQTHLVFQGEVRYNVNRGRNFGCIGKCTCGSSILKNPQAADVFQRLQEKSLKNAEKEIVEDSPAAKKERTETTLPSEIGGELILRVSIPEGNEEAKAHTDLAATGRPF